MSRCKSCDRIMKKCDLDILMVDELEEMRQDFEEDLCRSCRQEIYKHSPDNMEMASGLGFPLEEVLDMEEGLFIDYKSGGFSE